MKAFFFLSSAIVSALLNGCALTRLTDPYAPIMPEGVTARRDTVFSGVDRVTGRGAPDSLTLDECIAATLADNPDLRAARAQRDAAGARVRQARSALLPSVHLQSGYEQYSDPQRILPPHGGGDPGVFGDRLGRAEAVVSLPLFTGGRAINGVRAAAHAREAQHLQTGRLRDEMVFAVTRLYHTIRGMDKRAQAVGQSIEAMEARRRRVAAMLEAKKAARVDLLRTDVRVAELHRRLLVVRNEWAALRTRLGSLMATDIADRPLASFPEVDSSVRNLDRDTLFARALHNRGDYLAARQQLQAQARRVDIARGVFVPVLAAKAGYGIRSDLSGDYEPGGSAGVTLSIPLFEGGRNAAKIAEERALLAARQSSMEALRLRIESEIETAMLDIASAREQVESAHTAIEAAKEGLRIENVKYEQGKGTISEVLDAQAELLAAQSDREKAATAVIIALAQVHFVTGGAVPLRSADYSHEALTR